MFLKNYTSDVPASITINRIVSLLVQMGVAQIGMDYADGGKIKGIAFSIQIEKDKPPIPIRFPADVDGAQRALFEDYAKGCRVNDTRDRIIWNPGRGTKSKTKADFRDQAERTAWRLMQDWLEIQISMVQLQQAEFMQVFLPYAWDGKQSYFQRIKQSGFLALEAARPQETTVE